MSNRVYSWFRKTLRLNRRYGVRFTAGSLERTGFYTRREAEAFLVERQAVGIVFHYEPVDLRLLGEPGVAPRSHYVGDR